MSQLQLGGRCRCGNPRESGDFHSECLLCLGERHLKDALVDRPSCLACAADDYRGRLNRLLRYHILQTDTEVQGLEDALAQDSALLERVSRARARSIPPFPTQRDTSQSSAGSSLAMSGQRTALRSRHSTSGVFDGASASLATPDVATAHRGAQTVDSSSESSEAASLDSSPDRLPPRQRAPPATGSVGAEASAATPGADSTVTAVFTRAAGRLGLEMPPLPTIEPTEGLEPMPGERVTDRPRATEHKFLPACTGFLGSIRSAWNGANPPSGLGFKTAILGAEGEGVSSMPGVDTRLATMLAAALGQSQTHYSIPVDRPPFLAGPAARKASAAASRMFDGACRTLGHLNGSALLIGSLSALLQTEPSADTVDQLFAEAKRHTEILASLNRHAIQIIGWLLGLITRQERERWIAPIAQRSDLAGIAGRLRDLPVGALSLFPGGLELIQAEALESRERQEIAAQVMPPPAETSSKPPKKKATKKKRPASAAPAETQSTPPPPAATQSTAAEGAVPKTWSAALTQASKGKGKGRGKGK